jgi:hypothetical protein
VQGVLLGWLTVRRRLRDKPLEDLHLILQAVFNVFQPGRRDGISHAEEERAHSINQHVGLAKKVPRRRSARER